MLALRVNFFILIYFIFVGIIISLCCISLYHEGIKDYRYLHGQCKSSDIQPIYLYIANDGNVKINTYDTNPPCDYIIEQLYLGYTGFNDKESRSLKNSKFKAYTDIYLNAKDVFQTEVYWRLLIQCIRQVIEDGKYLIVSNESNELSEAITHLTYNGVITWSEKNSEGQRLVWFKSISKYDCPSSHLKSFLLELLAPYTPHEDKTVYYRMSKRREDEVRLEYGKREDKTFTVETATGLIHATILSFLLPNTIKTIVNIPEKDTSASLYAKDIFFMFKNLTV